jgi:putative transferase (TIGR04331 family)
MKNNSDTQIFLATTALENFWDASQPMLFLSDGCCRFSRRSFWEPLNCETLPCLWKNRKTFDEAYLYTNNVYETLLPVLSEALNAVHDKKYSMRYWRIFLGPWLDHYISVVYDRYVHLMEALKLYPNLTTIVMSNKCYVTPKDSSHFYNLIQDDPYNLQIYSRIFSFLGKQYPTSEYNFSKTELRLGETISFRGNVKRVASGFLNCLGELKKDPSVILMDPYFSFREQFNLFLKSGGSVRTHHAESLIFPQQPNNTEFRSRVSEIIEPRDEFELLLKRNIPLDLPQNVVETYESLDNETGVTYPIPAKIIGSAVLWYFQDDFKHWAAKAAESGTKLMGIQHGGNYGSASYMHVEEHELAITDYYCSWGWSSSAEGAKIITLPASKLVGRKRLGANNKKTGILLAVTSIPRYLLRLQNLNSGEFSDYLRWQFQFVASLSPEVKRDLKIRFRSDYGQDLSERWTNAGCSEDYIQDWRVNFNDSLKKSRLFVCGDLATVFAESLSADTPTILFCDPRVFTIRPEAESFYKELSNAGILYDNPYAAARVANVVYDDVETWWNKPERQRARQNFCYHFARTSPTALSEWIEELNRISCF